MLLDWAAPHPPSLTTQPTTALLLTYEPHACRMLGGSAPRGCASCVPSLGEQIRTPLPAPLAPRNARSMFARCIQVRIELRQDGGWLLSGMIYIYIYML